MFNLVVTTCWNIQGDGFIVCWLFDEYASGKSLQWPLDWLSSLFLFLTLSFSSTCTSEVSVSHISNVLAYVWEMAAAVQHVTLKLSVLQARK